MASDCVTEDTPSGHSILQLNATDKDAGLNGKVSRPDNIGTDSQESCDYIIIVIYRRAVKVPNKYNTITIQEKTKTRHM